MLVGYPPFYDDNPFGIYEKILIGAVKYPAHMIPAARDLISKLLNADRSHRLGNLRGGANDVKEHPWLTYCDWEGLVQKQIRAPIIPQSRFPGDTCNFERYPDLTLEEVTGLFEDSKIPANPSNDPYHSFFRDF